MADSSAPEREGKMMENMMKVLTVMLGLAVAGCVETQAARQEAPHSTRSNDETYEHPELHLKQLFGIDNAVLADTNRYPRGKGIYLCDVELPEPFGGYGTAQFVLRENIRSGELVLERVQFEKCLDEGSDDKDLQAAYSDAVSFVARTLGVSSNESRLEDVGAWRRNFGLDPIMFDSETTFELANGQRVQVTAKDARYVRRGGVYEIIASARIEIEFEVDTMRMRLPLLRRMGEVKKPVAIERELNVGPDVSERLSSAVWEALGQGDAKRREQMNFIRLTMAAENEDRDALVGLVRCYAQGRGCGKDTKKAEQLFKKALAACADDPKRKSEIEAR